MFKKSCDWCKGQSDDKISRNSCEFENDTAKIAIQLQNNAIAVKIESAGNILDGAMVKTDINYCPVCGRRLRRKKVSLENADG